MGYIGSPYNGRSMAMRKVLKVFWVDDYNGNPLRLELRRDGDLYRWYCQENDENNIPTGQCTKDTEVSSPRYTWALCDAEIVWGRWWNLRTKKRRQ